MTDPVKLRVLLVEDNELDARSMRWALEHDEGPTQFGVERVGDLAGAIEALDSTGYDCVLLDLSLPDSEGLIAVDAVIDHSPHAPVVVLTGLDDPRTAVAAVERGAQDYLTKGDATSGLVARSIRYAVARHHTETELRSTTELLQILQDRERIARDLHDTVVQQLFATGMSIQAAASQVTSPPIRAQFLDAVDDIDSAIRQLREAIFDLHLASADESLAVEAADIISREGDALGFLPSVRIGDIADVSESARPQLLAVLREGLSNVAQHASANAADVVVVTESGDLVVRITDNGRGLRTAEESAGSGNGLRNMEQRAEQLGGSFRIGPGPGGGTELEWRVPLD